MPRVTKAELESIAERLGRMLGRDLFIGYAYGRPRLQEQFTDTSVADISPRLPTGQLMEWMWAFAMGIEAGSKLRKSR